MTLIIAEAGVNHNGDEALALELIDAAHRAGADVVKFQTFNAASLATQNAQQAEYQVRNTGRKESQFDMLRRLELSHDAHRRLGEHCCKLGIEFLSTAFDLQSLHFLTSEMGLRRLKIPSGEITNAPLVLAHARTGMDLIVSTGMADIRDIENVLDVIAFGYLTGGDELPSGNAIANARLSAEAVAVLQDKVTLLHCTTEYPAPVDQVNLRAMALLRDTFGLRTGYSDHTQGILIPVAAAALGATVIEKHFTLDRSMEGPDHKASLEPGELKDMVDAIRTVETALGERVKAPTAVEMANRGVARKSLVAGAEIAEGDVFTAQNVAVKRPGSGMSPMGYWDLMGKPASRCYREGELLDE